MGDIVMFLILINHIGDILWQQLQVAEHVILNLPFIHILKVFILIVLFIRTILILLFISLTARPLDC